MGLFKTNDQTESTQLYSKITEAIETSNSHKTSTFSASLHATNLRIKKQNEFDLQNTPLTPKERKRIQKLSEIFLYYAQMINLTMHTSVSSIALSITTDDFPNKKRRIIHFLDYTAPHPAAKLVYKASEVHLYTHSDTSYLCKLKARSREEGFIYLSNKPVPPVNLTSIPPPSNTAVHILCKLIEAVMMLS